MTFNENNMRYVFDGEKVKKVNSQTEKKKNYFEKLYGEYGYDPERPLENVKREHERERIKHKMLRAMLFVMVLTLALTVAVKLFFDVKEVEVTGSKIYGNTEVASACGLIGENIFFADADVIEDNLKKNFPMLKSVKAEKQFPNKIVLTLTDSQARYVMTCGEEVYVLSSELDVLQTASETVPDLPKAELYGATVLCVGEKLQFESEVQYGEAMAVISALDNHSISERITSVKTDAEGNATLEYESRLTVKVGNKENIGTKLTLAEAYVNSLGEDAEGIIDAQTVEHGSYLPA